MNDGEMNRGSIASGLKTLAERDRHRFHMPGHGGRGLPLAEYDVTEVPGADNLHDAKGIIDDAQKRIAEAYHAEESHILVGGTTAGNIAAVLTSVPPGCSLLVPTNCHRSVFSALALGRIDAHFIDPVVDPAGFASRLNVRSVEDALDRYPDIAAMILTNPTYYGTISDTAAIAELLHDRGKILIVDEAHGAHLAFCHGCPEDAVSAGADLVIQSAHKMLRSYTQSAVIHRCSKRVSEGRLRQFLSMIQSSSPSYLLMSSVESGVIDAEEHADAHFSAIADARASFRSIAGKNSRLSLYDPGDAPFDQSKWLFVVHDGRGLEIAEDWRKRFSIYLEIETPRHLLAYIGMGTTKEDIESLKAAVSDACAQPWSPAETPASVPVLSREEIVPVWQALMAENIDHIHLSRCVESIAAEPVIPYPPGIPIILPGCRITGDTAEYLMKLYQKNQEIIGVDSEGKIAVLADTMEK